MMIIKAEFSPDPQSLKAASTVFVILVQVDYNNCNFISNEKCIF